MRICRFESQGQPQLGLYADDHVLPLAAAAEVYAAATHRRLPLEGPLDLLACLPPDGQHTASVRGLAEWVATTGAALVAPRRLPLAQVQLLVPIPRPQKLFLLAGNYAEHIVEGGGMAVERTATFPYVFMKPPSTTLTDPGRPVRIPRISPAAIDWELELAVVIGRRAKGVSEAEALSCVAGYTVVNDISNRKFRPNPGRQPRERDAFFDWLHGKWFDSFCPCGPCVVSAADVPDPQRLKLQLKLNGQVQQNATTGQQIFPVAAVIEFISAMVTLEPGDLISTGTPAGVGSASGTFLRPGDRLEAWIESIGVLTSPVEAEAG